MGLEHGNNLSKTLISHFFQHTEYASLKEDLSVAQSVLCRVKLESQKNLLGDNLAISKSLRDSVGGEDRVSTKCKSM
jgi:hypothetical protein